MSSNNSLPGFASFVSLADKAADNAFEVIAQLRAHISDLTRRLAGAEGERDSAKMRGDNHAETLRGVRRMLSDAQPDTKRVLLWVSDGLFGYSEPLEATLLKANDERNDANTRAEAAEARVRELEATIDAMTESHAHDDMAMTAAYLSGAHAGKKQAEAFKARVMAWALGRCGACEHEGSEDDTCYDCNSDDERSNWTMPKAWEVGE